MKKLPKYKVRHGLRPEITDQAVMVETETKFLGQKVFILVPISTGIDPKELSAQFTEQLNGLVSIASQPTLKDLAVMSANSIDNLKKRALESEN